MQVDIGQSIRKEKNDMKKTMRQILALFLAFAMCITAVDVQAYADTTQNAVGGSGWDGVTNVSVYEGENFRVTFSLTSYWEGGFNANVRIENTGTETIENWSLGLDYPSALSHVWNAEVIAGENGHYIVKNAGWNQDIPVGGSVEFGIGEQENFYGFPTNYELIGKLSDISIEDYAVGYMLVSDWESGFSAAISIGNRTERAIEDWVLEFDFDREITELWNGKIDSHEGNHYVIKNADYNSIIGANATITIGFNGIGGKAEDEPQNCILRSCLTGGIDSLEPGTEEDGTEDDVSDDFQYNDFVDWSSMTDSDGDGLPDDIEADYGTDPLNADTDGDGLTDGYEVLYSSTDPTTKYTDPESGVSDGEMDFDEDGLTNLEEQELGTDCYLADTDSDLLMDGEEVRFHGTDPLNADTDGDTMLDGYELIVGLDPLNPRTFGYPDEEYRYEYAVEADSDLLAPINSNNEQYQMSVVLEGSGGAISELVVRDSAYSNVIRQDYTLGCVPEILLLDDEKEDGITGMELSFKINDNYISDEEDVEELRGLGRYNIFKYIEELNFLCPVNTTEDEESRCIKAMVDGIGTYCVVDMKLWLNTIGFEAVAAEETAGIEPDSIVRMMDLKGSGVNYNLDTIDIAFCINSNDTEELWDDELDAIKAEIGKICKGIKHEGRSARFYLIDQNGKVVCNRYGEPYATSASEFESMLHTLKTTLSTEKTLNKQIDTLLDVKMRVDAYKAVVFLGGGIVTEDRNLSVIQKIADSNIRGLAVWPWWETGDWYDLLAGKTGGQVFTNYFNFANDVLNYIYTYIPDVPDVIYHTIASHNLNTIKLEKPLVCKGDTDTDRDSLTDWEEVDQKQVQLINGIVLLPSLKEYIATNSDVIPWYVEWIEKYQDMTNKNGDRFIEIISRIYILPVVSDPVSEDGDGDGILDLDDKWDGKDNRYKKLNPLHKDTIETLFPEIEKNSRNKSSSPSYLKVTDNNIVMTLKVKFMGDTAVRARDVLMMESLDTAEEETNSINNCTLKELIMDGIPARWNGAYKGTEYDFCKGMKVNFSVEVKEDKSERGRNISVTIRSRVCGVSNQSGVNWNADCNRKITMYTSRCEVPTHKDQVNPACGEFRKNLKTICKFESSVAHEFGHVMGLKDMYATAYCNHGYEPEANDEIIYNLEWYPLPKMHGIMLYNGSAVGNDIEMILYAFVENKWQYYVPHGIFQKASKAIRSNIIYINGDRKYRWNSKRHKMEAV